MFLISDFINNFASLSLLKKCEIFTKNLVDPLLVDTYAELPKLPRYALHVTISISKLQINFSFRMADFSFTWGPPSNQGNYMLSQIESLYKSPNIKWVYNWLFYNIHIINNSGLDILNPLLLSIMIKLEQQAIFPALILIQVCLESKMLIILTRTWCNILYFKRTSQATAQAEAEPRPCHDSA